MESVISNMPIELEVTQLSQGEDEECETDLPMSACKLESLLNGALLKAFGLDEAELPALRQQINNRIQEILEKEKSSEFSDSPLNQ